MVKRACGTCKYKEIGLGEEPCKQCDGDYSQYEEKKPTNEDLINAMSTEEKAKFLIGFPDFDRYIQDRWCLKLCPHRTAGGDCDLSADGDVDCPYDPEETAVLWLKAEAKEREEE